MLLYFALDVTANCISGIHCLALDGFDLNTVRKLNNKERKSWQSQDSNPVLQVWMLLRAIQPPKLIHDNAQFIFIKGAETEEKLHSIRQELLRQDHQGRDGWDAERLGQGQDHLWREGQAQDPGWRRKPVQAGSQLILNLAAELSIFLARMQPSTRLKSSRVPLPSRS